jgi:chromosome segregation ATPase
MKKTAILTMIVSLVIVNFCLTAYAEDPSSEISALEQKAERVQNQINQAKQQSNATVDAQVKSLNASIDSLIKQRVQVDSHIARLEGQVSELKQSADTGLSRQVTQYQTELMAIKQQVASLMQKKNAAPAQKADGAPAPAGSTPADPSNAAAGTWSTPATAPQK